MIDQPPVSPEIEAASWRLLNQVSVWRPPTGLTGVRVGGVKYNDVGQAMRAAFLAGAHFAVGLPVVREAPALGSDSVVSDGENMINERSEPPVALSPETEIARLKEELAHVWLSHDINARLTLDHALRAQAAEASLADLHTTIQQVQAEMNLWAGEPCSLFNGTPNGKCETCGHYLSAHFVKRWADRLAFSGAQKLEEARNEVMAKPITWAIRATLTDGRVVFMRRGGVLGSGPIATYRAKADAEADAEALSKRENVTTATVIERSHGRQWPS